jgi:exo-beta-1,3-glucanase (GH17 family)
MRTNTMFVLFTDKPRPTLVQMAGVKDEMRNALRRWCWRIMLLEDYEQEWKLRRCTH